MGKIVVILGHPDPAPERLCRALAQAYVAGARQSGHEVTLVDLGQVDVPYLRGQGEWKSGAIPEAIHPFAGPCAEADHFVIVYPLWLGTMPAILKAFLEQVFRPGLAFEESDGDWPRSKLAGKSARIVVTMGMPVFAYRWYFFAHSLKNLERNILGFAGISPIRERLYGMVESVPDATRQGWIEEMREWGEVGM